MGFYHEPVMAAECIEALNIKEDGVYVDGTAGGGGHSRLIAARLKKGRLICIDRDGDAISHSMELLNGFENISFINDNFKNLARILDDSGIAAIDGILLDLGTSSHQLDQADRGFSYIKDAPVDMRMCRTDSLSAFDVINGYSEGELKRIFSEYGEEKFSGRIARRLVEERQKKPIKTTLELASIIECALPYQARIKGSHPAKRVFQAVRIEVNNELEGLYEFIKEIPECLNKNGRIVVITFHSLEDRIVKRAFYDLQNPCKCPSELPVCVCGKTSAGKVVNRKPTVPGEEEIKGNTRSKSAKMRAFEKT